MYTCPMHPEIREEQPGKCPKCGGMDLVPEEELQQPVAKHHESKSSWSNYMPLIVVLLLITVVTAALTIVDIRQSSFVLNETLRYFMAGFFIVFAGFKLIDLKGFVEGYTTYDLLAQRFRAYAWAYPFIELSFGIAMVVAFHPAWLLWAEFLLMTFSGIGVVIKIAKKEQFQCACLGTVLTVPLTGVTVVEDFGMAALALLLLFL